MFYCIKVYATKLKRNTPLPTGVVCGPCAVACRVPVSCVVCLCLCRVPVSRACRVLPRWRWSSAPSLRGFVLLWATLLAESGRRPRTVSVLPADYRCWQPTYSYELPFPLPVRPVVRPVVVVRPLSVRPVVRPVVVVRPRPSVRRPSVVVRPSSSVPSTRPL